MIDRTQSSRQSVQHTVPYLASTYRQHRVLNTTCRALHPLIDRAPFITAKTFEVMCHTLHPLIDRTPVITSRVFKASCLTLYPLINRTHSPTVRMFNTVLRLASINQQRPIIDKQIPYTRPFVSVSGPHRLATSSMVLLVEAQFGSTMYEPMLLLPSNNTTISTDSELKVQQYLNNAVVKTKPARDEPLVLYSLLRVKHDIGNVEPSSYTHSPPRSPRHPGHDTSQEGEHQP